MMPRSIAKVNAKSIDGYFGVGTSCFFIRGTILSDTPVNGEYLTLAFARPGNTIEIASFDRIWAVVTIRTRTGSRAGDNVVAHLYLRDDDLKAHGVDCARIELLMGLPFTFDVAALSAEGLFDQQELEPYEPIADDPGPPQMTISPVPARPDEPLAAPPPPPEPVRPPEPQPAEPQPPKPAPQPDPVAGQPVVDEPAAAMDLTRILEMLRTGRSPFGDNPLVQLGASVAAVAVPVLLYMALAFLKNKAADDDETL
jgi:hypothetical protein